MFYKFYGSYIVTAVAEFYRIAAGACTNVGNFDCVRFCGSFDRLNHRINRLFNIVQGRTKFYLPVAGCEAVFFVEFVVVFV